MKCRCIDRDCRTIESAVEIVERYEAILGEGTEKKNIVRTISDAADSVPSDSSRYHQNRINMSKSNDRTQAQDTNGHILNQILDRLEKLESCLQSIGTGDSTRHRQPVRRGVCFICQSPQHFLQDCPIYKKCIEEFQVSNGQESGNENPSALY